jgi:hypothetical protein
MSSTLMQIIRGLAGFSVSLLTNKPFAKKYTAKEENTIMIRIRDVPLRPMKK